MKALLKLSWVSFMIVSLSFLLITEVVQAFMNYPINIGEAWFYHALAGIVWLGMLCDFIEPDEEDEKETKEDINDQKYIDDHKRQG